MNIHRLCQYPYSGTFPTGTPLSLKKKLEGKNLPSKNQRENKGWKGVSCVNQCDAGWTQARDTS